MTYEKWQPDGRRLVMAAILLGIGLGGFFDGIVLYQILQWHHMVSTQAPPTTLENLELNTLGDGIFHAATWVVTVAGVLVLTFHAPGRRCARTQERPTEGVWRGQFGHRRRGHPGRA